ncbi:MAG: fluoride efflux transporter CrcB [Armatimonadota bacterium]|nr:fluoride efflux transporter CrcB [Armatimonadota bacterium]MDR5697058.1 fluoride efflux transporter CrcB [Armatimonadota bacterium]
MRIVLVVVGGAIGALLRYAVEGWFAGRTGISFPYGTLVVNVTGSFALGLLSVFTIERLLLSPEARLFVGVGLLGAYTTFSTWQYESWRLIESGSWPLAVVNLGGSLVLGFAALVVGVLIGRAL